MELKIDHVDLQHRNLIYRLQHILHVYIADINQKEAWSALADFILSQDHVIIPKQKYIEYLEMKKRNLNLFKYLTPQNIIKQENK